jgi:hypothetical protein
VVKKSARAKMATGTLAFSKTIGYCIFMDSELRFIWDENKNSENLRKHGIDFNTAIFVFNDPNYVKNL